MSIVKIQAELKAPKGQVNKFGNYRYRSAEDIIEAVKPIIAKYGYYLVISDAIEHYDDRFYVKAVAALVNEQNEVIVRTSGYAREEEVKKGMDAAQITGSASSYARKYALNGLFAIDDTKDADATNEHKDEVGDDKRLYLQTLLENTPFTEDKKNKMAIKIESFTKEDDYNKALKVLQSNQLDIPKG
jgi:hypothetical protein